jgi:peptidoglycan/LPS O-acetylase OafA/YrhL
MLRSTVAVLAGLVVTLGIVLITSSLTIIWLGLPPDGPPTTTYLALNLICGALAGLAGGWTAMRLAPHTPHGHVVALAVVILLISLPSLFSGPAPGQPGWYVLFLSILGPLSVLIGGFLGLRWRRRHPEAGP